METALCQSEADYEAWDDFLQGCTGASYWQLYGWLASYRPMGMQCHVLTRREEGRITAGAAFLSYALPMGLGQVFILPHGPVSGDDSTDRLDDMLAVLNDHFASHGAIYVQLWPDIARDDAAGLAPFERAGYTGPRLFRSHEFSSVLLSVDLAHRSEEQLLADARRNTRYYCRASQKTGLELRFGRTQEDLAASYAVWVENSAYHGFAPRPLSSYRIVMEQLVMRDKGVLLQAYKDGEMVGSIMVLFVGRGAVYAAGAIRRAHVALHPAEFLHLSAMRVARERSLLTYDLNNWGSPGTAQFKRGFRPEETRWATPRTRIMRPAMARLVCWGERYARPMLRRVARLKAKKHAATRA